MCLGLEAQKLPGFGDRLRQEEVIVEGSRHVLEVLIVLRIGDCQVRDSMDLVLILPIHFMIIIEALNTFPPIDLHLHLLKSLLALFLFFVHKTQFYYNKLTYYNIFYMIEFRFFGAVYSLSTTVSYEQKAHSKQFWPEN